jgi:hypothetical protein
MMSKIEEFVLRNGMSESAKREMLEILNESILEIGRGIMNEEKGTKGMKGDKGLKGDKGKVNKEKKGVKEGEKRYKSKKAEEYAEEHGISLEDFEIEEISKKDVETKVREMTKNNKEITKKVETKEERRKELSKREKVICSGINKKGEACKSVGTIQPEGAKKKYCFRHAEDFRSFECNSDSSDEEEEKESKKEERSDEEELVEEEYN